MENQLKKKYEEIEQLSQHIQHLENQLKEISEKRESVKGMSKTVSDRSHIKKDDIILAPVADGVFIEVKVADPEKVFMNVGAGCVVKYPKSDAEKMVKDQERSIEESYEQISTMLENLRMQIMLSQQNAQELLQRYEKGEEDV